MRVNPYSANVEKFSKRWRNLRLKQTHRYGMRRTPFKVWLDKERDTDAEPHQWFRRCAP